MSFSFSEFHTQAQKAVDHVRRDVSTLRTGRASVQLLDGVRVEAYGTSMQLVEVASVQAPDPTMLVISPWDKSLLGSIERAVQMAALNVNPVVDGDIVRIAIPPLTEETRREMVKQLSKKIEAGRVMLRTIRTDTKKDIDQLLGQDGISEDDITRDLKTLEDELKKYMTKLDEILANKEKELLTV